MKIKFNQTITQNFEATRSLEWLETNGLGGWASSTITGCHTRRYHGLLCAATLPPVGRMVLVSKLDETILVNDKTIELGCNDYGSVIHPRGFQYLKSFEKNLFPEFYYAAEGIEIKKTIAGIQGQNTTVILYEILKAPVAFEMSFLPLLAMRDFHSHAHANQQTDTNIEFSEGVMRCKPFDYAPAVFIGLRNARVVSQPDWYYNFHHSAEQERGLDFIEDLFTPCKLTLTVNEGLKFGVILSTESIPAFQAITLFEQEKARREALLATIPAEDTVQQMLVLAADQFIVKRGDNLKTIIAGYPWFSDWGRDTMIAISGLCTYNNRLDDARKIFKAFAHSLSEGMLPNRFSDNGEEIEYNTADASLWFFVGIYQFWQVSGDDDFVKNELIDALKSILEWHEKGTRYHIHADTDGLLTAGEKGVQLTWMDAKVGDWVVTPRQGKAVEINALWYNAHKILAELLNHFEQKDQAKTFTNKARKIKDNFVKVFWNEDKKCLYDFIDGGTKNDDIRPNQLFAISLPFSVIKGEKAHQILDIVEAKLLTPVGLRSLSADNPAYKLHYGGDQWQRDGAYHQGTVWSWLLGAYVNALQKHRSNTFEKEITKILTNFEYHYHEAGLGSISEIFDAEAPHKPQGCTAQAWSVGEMLRIYNFKR